MKPVLLGLVLVAGGAAAWIASRAPARDYVPPSFADAASAPSYPERIVAPLPPGHELRTYAVTGPCCAGCCGKLYEALAHEPGVEAAAVEFGRPTAIASAVVPLGASDAPLLAALTFEKYSARRQP